MKSLLLISALLFTTSFSAAGQQPAQGPTRFVLSPDSIRLAYEVRGEGTPALIFVHGWSCDRSYWRHQLQPFAQRYKVVAIDLAGHGESGLGRDAWTMEAFGRDVVAVVNELGLQQVILIGHSMGGDVIAEAARQLKGHVKGLIMVDAYKKLGPGRSPEEVQALLAPMRADFVNASRAFIRTMFLPTSDSTLVEWVVADMSSAPPAVALGAVEAALHYSRQMPKTLQELHLPVIALNPDNTPTDTASLNQYGVEVVLMPGVGHFLMMEDPPRFNHLLSTAISKLTK